MSEEFYHLLIYKKLRDGALPPDKAALLDAWLKNSPENARDAAEIETIWTNTHYAAAPPVDVKTELAALKNRIREIDAVPTRTNKTLRVWLWAAAAVTVAVVAAVSFWNVNKDAAEKMQVASSGDSLNQKILLPDGSMVWLNQHSELLYPERFNGPERHVTLQGEAFFEVTKDPSKPFVVEAGGCSTRVLGTSFNVRAKTEESTTEIVLVSGRVRVESAKEQVEIVPGQAVLYQKTTQALQRIDQAPAASTTWHTGELLFQNTPLQTALAQLSRLHGQNFSLENQAMASCGYSAFFPKNDLNAVLANLEAVFGFKIVKSTDGYRLLGGRCVQ